MTSPSLATGDAIFDSVTANRNILKHMTSLFALLYMVRIDIFHSAYRGLYSRCSL